MFHRQTLNNYGEMKCNVCSSTFDVRDKFFVNHLDICEYFKIYRADPFQNSTTLTVDEPVKNLTQYIQRFELWQNLNMLNYICKIKCSKYVPYNQPIMLTGTPPLSPRKNAMS